MPGTLKCHGVVRELKEVGGEGGLRSEKLRGSLGEKREIQPHRAGLTAYQCMLDEALPGLLRQTRCSGGCSVPLRVRYSLGQPEAPIGNTAGGHCTSLAKRLAADVPDEHAAALGPASRHLDSTASLIAL